MLENSIFATLSKINEFSNNKVSSSCPNVVSNDISKERENVGWIHMLKVSQ